MAFQHARRISPGSDEWVDHRNCNPQRVNMLACWDQMSPAVRKRWHCGVRGSNPLGSTILRSEPGKGLERRIVSSVVPRQRAKGQRRTLASSGFRGYGWQAIFHACFTRTSSVRNENETQIQDGKIAGDEIT